MGDIIELAKLMHFDPLIALALFLIGYVMYQHSKHDAERDVKVTEALNGVTLATTRVTTLVEGYEDRVRNIEYRLNKREG